MGRRPIGQEVADTAQSPNFWRQEKYQYTSWRISSNQRPSQLHNHPTDKQNSPEASAIFDVSTNSLNMSRVNFMLNGL
jgi:hypothetical protein